MTPVFDVRTLFFVGAVASALCAAMLWLSRRAHARSREGMVWSAAALLSYGAAMGLIALRGWVPDWMSFPVANALGCAAAPVMYEGVRRIVGERPFAWPIGGVVVAIFALQFWLGSDTTAFDTRLLLTSVFQGGFAALCLPPLWRRARSREDPPQPLYWAIVFLVLMTVGHGLRFAVTAIHGAVPSPTGMVQGPAQMLMPTLFALSPMVYALVLVGLVNGRIATELWTLASVDMLTGVRTRRRFLEDARQAVEAGDGALRPVLLMLDLDRFKQVNDRHGHAAGDQVLVRFAALLREHAPPDALIGRHGGEEFCVLLRVADASEGRVHAQLLCETVRGTEFGLAGAERGVTVSIGIADGRDGTTLEALLLAADRRLYRAKREGRDRVVHADPAEAGAPGPQSRARTAGAADPADPAPGVLATPARPAVEA